MKKFSKGSLFGFKYLFSGVKTLFTNSVWGVPYAKVFSKNVFTLSFEKRAGQKVVFQVLDRDTGMDISFSEEAITEEKKDQASKCRIS